VNYSYLFVPGDRPERFDRAIASGAHAIVIDLEDAVQPHAKDTARSNIAVWLKNGGKAVVRINGSDTPWHNDDISLLASPGIRAVMLPKAEDPKTVAAFISALPAPLPVIALIETARGLWNIENIVGIKGITQLGFGSVDFQLDTGIEDENDGLLYARSQIVLASAMAELAKPLDGVTVDLGNMHRLERDTTRARGLGFGGKMCIHPSQVQTVNQGLAPTPETIAWAERVVNAADKTDIKGAIRLDGKMIDRPVIERARLLLKVEVRAQSFPKPD